MSVCLWTFCSEGGEDVLLEWADSVRLPMAVRALVDQKLMVLRQQAIGVLRHTHLLAGPFGGQQGKHIYKVRVNGTIAVRVMVCLGPFAMDRECTILAASTERDGKLVPRDVIERAQRNRAVLMGAPLRRKPYEYLGREPAH